MGAASIPDEISNQHVDGRSPLTRSLSAKFDSMDVPDSLRELRA